MKLRARFVVAAMAWSLLSAFTLAADVVKQTAEKPATGQLILEGKQIDRLVLSDKQGKVVHLVHPGGRVSLPAGEYQIEEIELHGGFITRWSVTPPSAWAPQGDRLLTIRPDKPCRPNIGGPLKAHINISAKRVGRLVKASYQLSLHDNQQLWSYWSGGGEQASLPHFAVYQGDRDITALGTGWLEYG